MERVPGNKAIILPTHTPALFKAALLKAADLLRQSDVVGVPTETVYGLAANAFDPQAVEKIFQAKGRPPANPLIVHVSSLAMAKQCVAEWPVLADRLAASFWPGPLTLVLRASSIIPPIVTAHGDTVGIRWPSHPFVRALISACGFPLAAPSANPSNQLSATTAQHVAKSLGDTIPLIVDGGPSHVGIESTVLDLTVDPPVVLRPGMIHEESLLAVTNTLTSRAAGSKQTVLRSPGQLPRHYSPKAKLQIWRWVSESELSHRLDQLVTPLERIHVLAHQLVPTNLLAGRVSVIPHDPAAFARALYAELHRCDEQGAELIVVEAVPESPDWRAITDRLTRAAR